MFQDYLRQNGIRLLDRYSGTWWFRWLSPINHTLWSAVRRAADTYAQGNLLDAGAGRRPYATLLRARINSYLSVDVQAPAGGGIDRLADLHTLDLGRRFDTILCSQVLEHSHDPGEVLRRLQAHLAPGGRLILTAPHLSMLHNQPNDYYRYTEYGLRTLLKRAGLEPVQVSRVGGIWVFLGHLVSTLSLNLTYGIPFIRSLALAANLPLVAAFLLLDRVLGFPSLLPTDYVVVAKHSGGK